MTNDNIRKLVDEALEEYKERHVASLCVENRRQLKIAYHLLERALMLDGTLLEPLYPECTGVPYTKAKGGNYVIRLEAI